MSASQRRKGAAGEREWVEALRCEGFITAGRQLGQARDGGGDVLVDGTLFEVKRRAGISSLRFLDQARAAAEDQRGASGVRPTPVVAMREDGNTEWVVMMLASDYFALLRKARPMWAALDKPNENR